MQAPKKSSKRPGKVSPIPAGKFKAQCLKLMDEVRDRNCEIVITKRGKPVAKLVPFEDKRPDIFGYMKGSLVILGDIVGPTGEIWDADR
jgi:prevent-host-death family protein